MGLGHGLYHKLRLIILLWPVAAGVALTLAAAAAQVVFSPELPSSTRRPHIRLPLALVARAALALRAVLAGTQALVLWSLLLAVDMVATGLTRLAARLAATAVPVAVAAATIQTA